MMNWQVFHPCTSFRINYQCVLFLFYDSKTTLFTNLRGESCLSASLLLMLMSGERLRPLLGGDLVLDGEWLCFDVLSEALVEGWWASLWRGEALRFLMGL